MLKGISQKHSTKLHLCELEKRATPAVFTVNSLADTGDVAIGDGVAMDGWGHTTLRAAIQEANFAAPGGPPIPYHTIVFHPELPLLGDEILLTSNLPSIKYHLDITGIGPEVIRISGDNQFEIFRIDSGGSAILKNLGITSGKTTSVNASGGVYISPFAEAILQNCVISNCLGVNGGGIHNNSGTLYATDCEIKNCKVDFSLADFDPNLHAMGGGIYSTGYNYLMRCEVFFNTALTRGAGIYLAGDDLFQGYAELIGCEIFDNSFDEDALVDTTYGGGVCVEDNIEVNISNSVISTNVAVVGGGIAVLTDDSELHLVESWIAGNFAVRNDDEDVGYGKGGGIFAAAESDVTISYSIIEMNYSEFGGAIYLQGPPVLVGPAFQLDLEHVQFNNNFLIYLDPILGSVGTVICFAGSNNGGMYVNDRGGNTVNGQQYTNNAPYLIKDPHA